MSMLKFKKGLFANLPSTYSAGTVYVTTDEQAMYVDISDSKRIRLSDIIQVPSVADLAAYAPDYSTSALYYVVASNALLKYVGVDAEGKYEWKQINTTAAVESEVAGLKTRMTAAEGNITGLQTSVNDITTQGGAIDVAKQAAIDAAAADATSKANTAEANAKADTKAKVDALTEVVNGKVDTTTFNASVEQIGKDIAAAESAAKSHADTKASAAESAAKSHADTEIGKAKDELQGKIDLKADQSAVETSVSELEGKITAAISTAAADATSKANTAEANAKTYADGLKTALETTITEGLATKVDNAVYEAKVNTLETKEDAAKKLAEAKTYAETKASAAQTAAKDYTDAEIVKVNTEVAKKATSEDLTNAVNSLNTAIGTAKQEAINAAAIDATSKANAAEAAAKGYTDAEIDKIEEAIGGINTSVNGKVDTAVFEAAIDDITKAETGKIAVAEKAAKDHADSVAAAAQTAAEATAKSYTDAEIVKVNAEVDKKADADEVATTVAGLETAISTAKTDAITEAGKLANAAQAAAESTAATALSSAKTELEGKINAKADKTALESAVNTLNTSISTAEQNAKDYADDEIAKALQGADAMKFIGVLGGEGNIQALPAAADTNAGDTYKIGAVGTYAGYDCRVGDLLVAKEDGKAEYWHVSSGYEAENNPTLAKGANDEIVLTSPVGVNLGSVAFTAAKDAEGNLASAATVSVAHVYDAAAKTTQAVVTVGMEWEEF